MTITITLLGNPVPYRHRSRQFPSGHVVRYLPKKQRDVAAALRIEAQNHMVNYRLQLITEPVRLGLFAEFIVPQSWSRKKHEEALSGKIRPTCRPDLTNILKLAEDCLSGIVFKDDSLVVEQRTVKRYGAWPRIVITVEPL